MLRIIILSFIFCLSSPVFLQVNKLKKLEMEIVDLLKYDDDFEEMYPARVKAKEKLIELIKLDSNFLFPLDSLKKYASVKYSDDKKIRKISWDMITGGNWHDYTCIGQYKNGWIDFNPEECGSGSCFTDASIYKFIEIKLNEKKYYLTYAYGTHGAGHHHDIARVYHFKGAKLIQHKTFLNSKEIIVMECQRRHRPDFTYDPISKTLSHPEFKMDPNHGFKEPTGKILFYKLTEKGFMLQ